MPQFCKMFSEVKFSFLQKKKKNHKIFFICIYFHKSLLSLSYFKFHLHIMRPCCILNIGVKKDIKCSFRIEFNSLSTALKCSFCIQMKLLAFSPMPSFFLHTRRLCMCIKVARLS